MARVAIVTGGTRGIGEAVSIALRDAGFTVAANFVGSVERADAFAKQAGIATFQWDVADYEACQSAAARIADTLGPVDVLVNKRGLAKLPKTSVQYCEPERPSTLVIGPKNHRRWEISLNPGEDADSVRRDFALDHTNYRRLIAALDFGT